MRIDSRASVQVAHSPGITTILSDYYDLTKPSIVWLILMSTMMGVFLASDDSFSYTLALNTLLATALLAAGTGALNQWWERESDARMRRTQDRPLPAGKIQPLPALLFASGLSLAGLIYLLAGVNALCFGLGLFTLVAYNFVYTPLKTRTWWSTLIGAFPGAIPLLMGWAAVRNGVGLEGWVLFGILFLWQFPHFYAIAWMYREDYERVGICMLPVIEPSGRSTSLQIVGSSVLLVPLSIAPAWLGMVHFWYVIPAFLISVGYLAYGITLAIKKTGVQARALLRVSVLYLPLLYLFLLICRL